MFSHVHTPRLPSLIMQCIKCDQARALLCGYCAILAQVRLFQEETGCTEVGAV